MATLRNKRKLAAVSRETPESTRSGKAPSVLDPELTQEYISQVSEEIEGRVTKKLSKEFSRTESRILGALSKLDEFLLNPQVRTCSVVAPGTSRSNNLESQGTNEDRPSDDPGPEVEFASPISGAETNPHSNGVSPCFIFDIVHSDIFSLNIVALQSCFPPFTISCFSSHVQKLFKVDYRSFKNTPIAICWCPWKTNIALS